MKFLSTQALIGVAAGSVLVVSAFALEMDSVSNQTGLEPIAFMPSLESTHPGDPQALRKHMAAAMSQPVTLASAETASAFPRAKGSGIQLAAAEGDLSSVVETEVQDAAESKLEEVALEKAPGAVRRFFGSVKGLTSGLFNRSKDNEESVVEDLVANDDMLQESVSDANEAVVADVRPEESVEVAVEPVATVALDTDEHEGLAKTTEVAESNPGAVSRFFGSVKSLLGVSKKAGDEDLVATADKDINPSQNVSTPEKVQPQRPPGVADTTQKAEKRVAAAENELSPFSFSGKPAGKQAKVESVMKVAQPQETTDASGAEMDVDALLIGEEKKPSLINKMGSAMGRMMSFGGSREVNLPSYEDLGNQALGEDAARFITANEDAAAKISLTGLSLDDFLKLVAMKNDRIAYQRMEWAIASAGRESARGLYEPALTATYRYTDSNTPNTTEEEFRRSFAPEFIEKNSDYTLGIEGMIPTGAKLRASYTYRQIENNIQPTPIRGEEDKSYVGLSLTQPILKGAGGRMVVEAPILVAGKEKTIAMETFRQAMFQTTSQAAMAFWDAYVAAEKLKLRQKSVEIAEGILRDERERNRLGQSSDTRVMSAESALAQRKVQLFAARQEVVQLRSQLRTFVANLPGDVGIELDGKKSLISTARIPEKEGVLMLAFDSRPEYRASLVRAEKEDIRIKYAENNRLPQLDLIASYGYNGLDVSFSESWSDTMDRDHETMYVGLEFRMMMLGDRKGKGELTAARLRKHQALLEIKAAEIAIHNSVDTAIRNLETANMQVDEMDSISTNNKRLMEIELARFDAGQSNIRDLMELEERLHETLEIELDSRANLQKAVVGLAVAQGSLLKDFELER